MKLIPQSILIVTSFVSTVAFSGSMGSGPVCPQCESWSVAIHGGWMPTHYSSRESLYRFSQVGPGFSTGQSFKFDYQFKTPYVIGAEVARDFSCHVQAFLEGNYYHGNGDTYNFTSAGLNISQAFDDFKSYGFYVGGRYKFTSINESIVPYLGAKVGFIHYDNVNALESFNNFPIPSQRIPFYSSNTTISGGVQIGADYRINDKFSIGAKAELLASGARKSQVVPNAAPSPTIFVGNTGTLVSYPLEIVARYTVS